MPITPDTHPGRFTAQEAALFRAGKCCYVTATGDPSTEHCGAPSQPDADYGYCPSHRAESRSSR
jgi:hypothetical protein